MSERGRLNVVSPTPFRRCFSEPNDDRLLRRLQAVVGDDLRPAEVAQLASGDLSLIFQLSAPARQSVLALIDPSTEELGQLEKIVGSTTDYVPIAYLVKALEAAASVIRLIDLRYSPIGTGVMVSRRLLLTNYHVIPSAFQASRQLAQFRYELDGDGTERSTIEFRLDPEALLISSPVDQLDFTLVALGNRVGGTAAESADFGHASLSAASDKHATGDFVTLIQHPAGDYKQIALRENRIIGRGRNGVTLHYAADTLGGSSGSPVYNDQLQLIALHHSGGPRNEFILEDGRAVPADSNEGIRISAIVRYLQEVANTLAGAKRDLLVEALDSPGSAPAISRSPLEARPVPDTTVPPTACDKDWIRMVLPSVGPVVSELEISRPQRTSYSNRQGYSPAFLGPIVPLPRLHPTAWAAAAVPVSHAGTDGVEVRYVHFSLVQNAARRMPFFAALNIDGGRGRDVNMRIDPSWYQDPRLHATEQFNQAFFDNQQPLIFRLGPIVRPSDVAWGTPSLAAMASEDTFHFTNCCPWAAGFSQNAQLWLGIESYVLASSKVLGNRISVFMGPIFSNADPTYCETLIPSAFWKVLVWSDMSGGLRAAGFIADHSRLPNGSRWAPNRAALIAVAQFQISIVEIERCTAISFGTLANFDVAAGRKAGLPMTTYEDATW
jgi:endonuclease G